MIHIVESKTERYNSVDETSLVVKYIINVLDKGKQQLSMYKCLSNKALI